MKIRVWHKLLEQYVPAHKHVVIDQNGEIGNDNVFVERFTGTIDNKGKEVFQEDIVQCYDGELRVVEWCDESGAFVMRHLPDSDYIDNLFIEDGSLLVVGNTNEGVGG